MEILDKHAKIKEKYVRANNAPFMNRDMAKAIMTRSRLKNNYNKFPTEENKIKFKKQRNFCVNLLKREKKKYYNDLSVENITDKKNFWKIMKPFFSDKNNTTKKITLVEGNKVVSNDQEVAEIMNKYFHTAVKDLKLDDYNVDFIPDIEDTPIQNVLEKYKNHPSIIKITQKNVAERKFIHQLIVQKS